jgi:hypothetical protein
VKDAPVTISRLVDIVAEYEDAQVNAPESEDDTVSFPNILELIDLVVRVIHECEQVTDNFRADLAQFEDELNMRREH